MLRKVLVVSVIVLALAFLLYEPIPDNIKEPWKTRVLLAILKLNGYVVCIYVVFVYFNIVILLSSNIFQPRFRHAVSSSLETNQHIIIRNLHVKGV